MGNKLLPLRPKPKTSSKNEGRSGKLSFRGSFLGSFRRSSSLRRMSWMPRPHLDCRTWLTQLELSQYVEAFGRFGGVEEFLYYQEEQIRDGIGIKNSSHRSRIMTSLTSLREKYEKNQKLKVDPFPRTSLIEGERSRNVSVKLDISPEVVLRHGKNSDRRNPQKREAAVISQNSTDDISFAMEIPAKSDPGETELKKVLEEELALDNSDLRSHAWYHGAISRERAESVMVENGNFIIRDCISQPGDYVLTCKWNDQCIHVIIQKLVIRADTIYERIQYKLEDETYDSIPDLVTAYVGSKRPITVLSGARISVPVNRTAPLSYYVSKYAAQAEQTRLHGTLSRISAKTSQQSNERQNSRHEPEMFQTSENATQKHPGENELKKLLEAELALDKSDLRSHAWYHGAISRERAEEVIVENGNFIIRDCISQPGDFVLTCKWNIQCIHVLIQKVVFRADTIYERIQYKLEDDTYDSIPDLVMAYVGSQCPITVLSGARISIPVNRTAPLSYYVSKYAAQADLNRLHGSLCRSAGVTMEHRVMLRKEPVGVPCSILRTSNSSPPRMRRGSGTSARTQRPSSGTFEERLTNSGDGILGARNGSEGPTSSFSSHSLPRRLQTTSLSLPQHKNPEITAKPDETRFKPTSPSPVSEKLNIETPPPKPSRVPSFKVKPRKPVNVPPPGERVYAEIEEEDEVPVAPIKDPGEDKGKTVSRDAEMKLGGKENGVVPTEGSGLRYSRLSEVYQPSGSDSGNGSGDSVQTSASDSRNRDSQMSLGDSGFLLAEDDSLLEEEENLLALPEMFPSTAFDLENFSTLLLPAIDNRPLDATAFKGIRNTLTESGSRILAAHLTKSDLDLLNGSLSNDYGLGVTMGIELVTLPQGSQLRKDLIERTECLKLLVAVSILKTENIDERADIIYRWILIAIDTKTAMGNLYGFTGIMLGLCVPEVQRLTRTWHVVRQKHTDSAFKFESKLRSTLKAMNECSNPQAPNTIIPHLLPYVLLCERDLEDIYSLHTKGGSLLQWESSTSSDYGLQMLYNHLQEGRTFTQNLTLYKRNAELILGDVKHMEELTLDMFRTEFHLKFLFGSKAAFVESDQRMSKFQKVIATLSEFCEPSIE